MKAGIGHLQDKLESFREEIKGQSYTVSDDTVTEVSSSFVWMCVGGLCWSFVVVALWISRKHQ